MLKSPLLLFIFQRKASCVSAFVRMPTARAKEQHALDVEQAEH